MFSAIMLSEETEAKMCKLNLTAGADLSEAAGLTDEEILKSESPRKAFEILSERYTGRVIALARTFKSDDDLIEEGLIALFRAIETYDETKGAKFSTYAYTCIKNRISDASKKGQAACVRQAARSLEIDIPTETDFTAVEAKTELNSLIENNLTKREGEIFRLRQSGMSYADISKLCGISKKSVDNAYFRAKTKLKKVFQNPD
jgi:RNA polymerase sporulation-specific sigma factor